jgi:hypothetical protein
MKALPGLSCLVLLASVAIPAIADPTPQYIYIRSNTNQPWGQTTNEDAMDNVFGSGNWTTMYFEDLNDSLFSAATAFIFMEGGDSSYIAFANFMQNHGNAVTSWVQSGGRLLIMSAPNDPLSSATLYLPDNVVLQSDAFYGSAASSAYAADISNPIFSGPNSTSFNFTGDFFSHGYFSGADIQPIMMSNLNEVVLGADPMGTGLMVFGGMTTDNFQLPQPAAHALLENIIYYTATTTL